MAMKLAATASKEGLRIRIAGEVEGAKCDCLDHFWRRRVTPPPRVLVIDMADVLEIDALGVSRMVRFIRQAVKEGGKVVLESPPQVLAHVLYKTAGLARVEIFHPRTEEPYAG